MNTILKLSLASVLLLSAAGHSAHAGACADGVPEGTLEKTATARRSHPVNLGARILRQERGVRPPAGPPAEPVRAHRGGRAAGTGTALETPARPVTEVHLAAAELGAAAVQAAVLAAMEGPEPPAGAESTGSGAKGGHGNNGLGNGGGDGSPNGKDDNWR